MSDPAAIRFERVSRDAARPLPGARARHFSGEVHMQALSADPPPDGIELLAVFFSAGARTRPHVHPVEQVLHVLEGEGVVAIEGERRRMRAGDIVVVPARLWHWHGATPERAMCHVSLKQPGDTDWNQPERDWGAYMKEEPV